MVDLCPEWNVVCLVSSVGAVSLGSFAGLPWIALEVSPPQVMQAGDSAARPEVDGAPFAATATIRLPGAIVLSVDGSAAVAALTSECPDANLVLKLLVVLHLVLTLKVVFRPPLKHLS